MEVNAALISLEAEGSFKAAWPTVAKLAGSKAKNMLNYSSFYNNFGMEDSTDNDSIAPLVFCTQANKVTLEFAHLDDYLAQGGRLALGPFLLDHIYRTLHDVVTDGMNSKHVRAFKYVARPLRRLRECYFVRESHERLF
ncbi:hypothetical protein Pyn_09851 [Prunus yedoensis var. nudiflora]|uniref:Uncharacterized protein n=1 Tax=Prunus yedoensis var. nudiflora TaxID=2094558 RepID=A0A314ULD8_PRUYE|nr:hypothetical protein Pyn_09851 [Prunus yedoensis var. nudiflora]